MSTTLITADELYQRVDHVVPAVEWATMADDVNAIMRLKAERNAVILAHNYMRPEIFHGISDIVGDSLALAIASLVLFGVGWGFFDGNNMPILSQIVRPKLRATGYGLMNLVSISCGGFADVGFGALRDHHVPLNVTFGVFAGVALISVVLVLLIKPPEPGKTT